MKTKAIKKYNKDIFKECDTEIANPMAVKENKRFIDTDMNRCFDCEKPKNYEEQIAIKHIKPMLKDYDLVIDIHSTKSDIKELIIVSNLNKKTKEVLKYIPIKNVVLMPANMCKGSLIKHCTIGISLEYKRKTKPEYVISQIKKMIEQKKEYSHTYFKVIGEYKVQEPFKAKNCIKELKNIKDGTLLGKTGKIEYRADLGFVALFTGKGRYKNTACLKLEKIFNGAFVPNNVYSPIPLSQGGIQGQ